MRYEIETAEPYSDKAFRDCIDSNGYVLLGNPDGGPLWVKVNPVPSTPPLESRVAELEREFVRLNDAQKEVRCFVNEHSKPKPELPILTYAEWKEKYGNDLIATYRYDTIPVHFKHIERMLAVEYARYLCKELVVHAELNGGKLNVSAFKDSPKNAVENFYRLLALSGKKQILENLFS